MAKTTEGTIYLLHFERPYKHAQHYLGFSEHLNERVNNHNSPLMRAVKAAGIDYVVARIWIGTYEREAQMHKWKNNPRLCPFCTETRRARLTEGA